MSKQSPDEAMQEMDTTIEDELNTILPGSEPLANLHARHEGGLEYSVLSARNGGVSYYWVTLGGEPSCTCEDFEYNVDDADERNICKHIAKSFLAERLGVEQTAAQAMLEHGNAMVNSTRTLEEVAGMIEDAVVKLRDASAGQTSSGQDAQPTQPSGSSGGGDPRGEPDTPDASDAAERLQSAFDDVLDDMQVKPHDGLVWFQTGRDTPDDWPFPGGDSTFDVVTGPDAVMFVHDGSADWADGPHKHFDKKPGEWWKNALNPSDVDDYISEVLE